MDFVFDPFNNHRIAAGNKLFINVWLSYLNDSFKKSIVGTRFSFKSLYSLRPSLEMNNYKSDRGRGGEFGMVKMFFSDTKSR